MPDQTIDLTGQGIPSAEAPGTLSLGPIIDIGSAWLSYPDGQAFMDVSTAGDGQGARVYVLLPPGEQISVTMEDWAWPGEMTMTVVRSDWQMHTVDWFTGTVLGTALGWTSEVLPGGTTAFIFVGAGSTSGSCRMHLAVLPGGPLAVEGIPSEEAFGLPRITGAPQDLELTGIPSAQAFGRVRVRAIGRLLRPSGIPSAQACGEPTLGSFPAQTIIPRGVASAEAFGAATVDAPGTVAPIQPTGLAGAAAVGTPIVLTSDPAAPVPRNILINRLTGELYPWPINHATEDPIRTLGRRLTRSGITASGRLIATRRVVLLSQAAHPGPVHLMLHGSMLDRDQQQYQKFVQFFEENDEATYDFIDASGDSYHIVIVGFDARRVNSPARVDGSYFTYSLECEVLNVNSGALRGYAI